MGAWGTGVYENDYAQDTSHMIKEVALPDFINYCLDTEYDKYHNLRLGADLLIRNWDWMTIVADGTLSKWILKTRDLYIEKLNELLNSDWIDEWIEPDAIRGSIQIQINHLSNIL